jgi:hypothetical protein
MKELEGLCFGLGVIPADHGPIQSFRRWDKYHYGESFIPHLLPTA